MGKKMKVSAFSTNGTQLGSVSCSTDKVIGKIRARAIPGTLFEDGQLEHEYNIVAVLPKLGERELIYVTDQEYKPNVPQLIPACMVVDVEYYNTKE